MVVHRVHDVHLKAYFKFVCVKDFCGDVHLVQQKINYLELREGFQVDIADDMDKEVS